MTRVEEDLYRQSFDGTSIMIKLVVPVEADLAGVIEADQGYLPVSSHPQVCTYRSFPNSSRRGNALPASRHLKVRKLVAAQSFQLSRSPDRVTTGKIPTSTEGKLSVETIYSLIGGDDAPSPKGNGTPRVHNSSRSDVIHRYWDFQCIGCTDRHRRNCKQRNFEGLEGQAARSMWRAVRASLQAQSAADMRRARVTGRTLAHQLR